MAVSLKIGFKPFFELCDDCKNPLIEEKIQYIKKQFQTIFTGKNSQVKESIYLIYKLVNEIKKEKFDAFMMHKIQR